MPKIFKHSDYHNKPHIVLVKGVNAKHTVNYIYKGIEKIDEESIVRAYEEKGNIIIYFKKPSKKFNTILNSNKSEISLNRSKLKLILSGFVYCCEKELNNNIDNPIIKDAINSLHLLAHSDISQDIKVEDLKKPLSQILNEIATPPAKNEIKKSTQKLDKEIPRGLDREALSKFNRMSQLESSEVIRFIDPPKGGSYFMEKDDTANIPSNKLIIADMQKFIAKYLEIPYRRIPTSTLARLAEDSANIENIRLFCEKWAVARKGMVRNKNEGKSLVFVWREAMDAIVICLNKHLFRSVGAAEIYSRVFSTNMVADPHNLFASPTPLRNLNVQTELRSVASPLSPAFLIAEDSADKKLEDTLKRVRFQDAIDNVKQQLIFPDFPVTPNNADSNVFTTDAVYNGNQEPDNFSDALSPSIEETVNNLLPNEGIFSPSLLPGRSLKRTQQNSTEVDGSDSIDRLIAELNNSYPVQNNLPVASGNTQVFDDMSARFLNFLDDDLLNLISDYDLKSERTPEKPDPDSLVKLQEKIQSVSRKASSNLTYEPLPSQSVLRNSSNTSSTNSTKNAI